MIFSVSLENQTKYLETLTCLLWIQF